MSPSAKILLKLLVTIAFLVGLVFLGQSLVIPECEEISLYVTSFGPLAPLIFFGLFILATVAFVPGTLVTMLAGLTFGPLWGSLLVITGATVGVVFAFLIGRYLCRGLVEKLLGNKSWFQSLKANVAANGFTYVLILRLVPAVPFNILNYACGISSVKLRDFALASLIGMAPGAVAYVYLGRSGCYVITPVLKGEFNLSSIPPEIITTFVGANVFLLVLATLPLFLKRYVRFR